MLAAAATTAADTGTATTALTEPATLLLSSQHHLKIGGSGFNKK